MRRMRKRKADGSLKLDSRRVDRLGGLPDDVLGLILGFLPTPQAVRASQLSRRWRRLWPAHVLALNLSSVRQDEYCSSSKRKKNKEKRGVVVASFPDLCTGALSRFPTPDIPSISLELELDRQRRAAYMGSPWYREATERAAGSVRVTVPRGAFRLELPRFTRAEALRLTLNHRADLELPAPAAVLFGRLTELVLATVRLPAGAPPLHGFLSSCCPRLRRLRLCSVRCGRAGDDADAVRGVLVLRSDALEVLDLENVDGLTRLDVATPNLRSLSLRCCFRLPASDHEVSVSAPRVESICWYRSYPARLVLRSALTRVRRLSGLKLATLGRSDPCTMQLLQACSLTTERLDMDLVLPDEATLLYSEYQSSSSCEEDLVMSHAPPLLPRVTALSLTLRWGLGCSVAPCLSSLLSRVPNVTTLYANSAPYCLAVLRGAVPVPPPGEYRWGAVQKISLQLESLLQVSVHGLGGSTDGEDCSVVEVLLGAVPPSIQRISLAFRHGTPASAVDVIAAGLRANFPMEAGRWTMTPCSTGLGWTKHQDTYGLKLVFKSLAKNNLDS